MLLPTLRLYSLVGEKHAYRQYRLVPAQTSRSERKRELRRPENNQIVSAMATYSWRALVGIRSRVTKYWLAFVRREANEFCYHAIKKPSQNIKFIKKFSLGSMPPVSPNSTSIGKPDQCKFDSAEPAFSWVSSINATILSILHKYALSCFQSVSAQSASKIFSRFTAKRMLFTRSRPISSDGWLYNDSAQDQLPCSSVGIALHYVLYARRNQLLYRWTNVYAQFCVKYLIVVVLYR